MPHSRPPIAILGIPFDSLTLGEALERIEQMICSRRPHYLVTANVDFLVQARQDVELRRILLEADLVLCDGTPLVWASRLLGNALPDRVAGADLVPLLIETSAEKQYRLFFLGAAPESSSQAVAKLRAAFPRLLIAGHYSPPYRTLLEMDHEEIKRRVIEARADVLLVSFGCPKQEKWIAMHFRQLGVPVTIGVGATIDFLAGQVRRAPPWMRRMGLEWVFRLGQEPRRLFRRYAKDIWSFGGSLLAQLWHLRWRKLCQGQGQPARPELCAASKADDWNCLQMPRSLDAATLAGNGLLEHLQSDGRHCLLDLSQVEFIDSTGLCWLVSRQKHLRSARAQLVLLAPALPVRRALELMRLQDFFQIARDLTSARALLERAAREQTQSVVYAPASGSRLLRWRGEITAANAPGVWQKTQAQLAALGSPGACLIDVSEVRFIDTAGLGLMLRAKRLAGQRQIKLSFAGFQPAVLNVLRLAHLEQSFAEG